MCPLPHDFQRSVNTVINPYLFLGRHNWLSHEIVVAPRHVGGLGLINSNHMAVALLGQIVAGLLLSTEPTGFQFRAALQEHMWREYKAIPAHLILRRGIPWRLMNSVLIALCQLRLSVSPSWDEITVPEMLSLPFYNDMYGFQWPEVSTTIACAWEQNGLWVWGDILWYNPGEKGKDRHPCAIPASFPLVPPSPAGVKNNYVPSRGHPDTYPMFSEAAGPLLAPHWCGVWVKLHPTVSYKLREISKFYRRHPDHSKSAKNPRPHDVPFDIDTIGLPFPWRIATLAGKPLREYTVKNARSFQAPSKIVKPDWAFEANENDWRQVWFWQTTPNLLTSAAQSDVFLFLQRRTWLAQKPQNQRRLASYATLDDLTLAQREDFFNTPRRESVNITEETLVEPTTTDSYEIEHVFGVTECMLCAGPKDLAAHGFIECPDAQRAWKAITPTLRKLVNGPGVPLDTRSIVLGWPQIKCPTARSHSHHDTTTTAGHRRRPPERHQPSSGAEWLRG